VGIEEPSVLEPARFSLARQSDNALDGNVRLQGNAKMHDASPFPHRRNYPEVKCGSLA
jgi:hypothetical protein